MRKWVSPARQIVEIYADIFERFGFDKREHEIAGVANTNGNGLRHSINQKLPKKSSGVFLT